MIFHILEFITHLIEKYRPNKVLPQPTVDEAWRRMHQMAEDFNNLCFYVSQIKDFDPTPDLLKYMEKADYGLLSTRDELKIALDRQTFQRNKEMHNASRSTSSSKNNPNPRGSHNPGQRRPGSSGGPKLPKSARHPNK
jgi:hypothetical protein